MELPGIAFPALLAKAAKQRTFACRTNLEGQVGPAATSAAVGAAVGAAEGAPTARATRVRILTDAAIFEIRMETRATTKESRPTAAAVADGNPGDASTAPTPERAMAPTVTGTIPHTAPHRATAPTDSEATAMSAEVAGVMAAAAMAAAAAAAHPEVATPTMTASTTRMTTLPAFHGTSSEPCIVRHPEALEGAVRTTPTKRRSSI